MTSIPASAIKRAAVDIYLIHHEGALIRRGARPLDWFGAYLVRLFQKADPSNLARLSAAFPAYGTAWLLYCSAPSERRFYLDVGVGELLHSEARALWEEQKRLDEFDPLEPAQ